MKFETLDQFTADLKQAVNYKYPFCTVSIGDGEAMFLLDVPYNEPNATNGVLHNHSELEDQIKNDTLNMLPTADYIFAVPWNEEEAIKTRASNIVWMQNIYSYEYILAMIRSNYKLANLFDRYHMSYSGHLFGAMPGARVVLVGHHAPDVLKLYYKSEVFRRYYTYSGINDVNIIDAIPCNKTHSILEVDGIVNYLQQTKDSYDVAIVSIGIPANYVCLKVKEFGKIAIDLGQGMTALAGYPDLRREHMEHYLIRSEITDV